MTFNMEGYLPSQLPSAWSGLLGSSGLQHLAHAGAALDATGDTENVTPGYTKIMRVFDLPPHDVQVIIVGQDPYPGEGLASGLAFSVEKSVSTLPGSLRNIRKELSDDQKISLPPHGDLSAWSRQGVLLLNRHLTTTVGTPGAHRSLGWGAFTDAVLRGVVTSHQHCVVVLWGKEAAQWAKNCGNTPTIVSAHPSPLSASRGFFGSRPFGRVNTFREHAGLAPLDWSLGEER
jgi:uracil-DNA glycosylase